jgi:excisionase family DNA binding protein
MTRSRLPIKPQRASRGWRGRGPGEPAPHPVPPPPDAGESLLLDSHEVSRLLGIGRTKAFQLMARGEVPVVRIGRCVRVPRPALMDWINDQTLHPNHLPVLH